MLTPKKLENTDSNSSRSENASDGGTPSRNGLRLNISSPRVNKDSAASYLRDVTEEQPDGTISECKLIRIKKAFSCKYECFGDEDELIFSAKKESTLFSTKFSIIETITGTKIGRIESNATSLIYHVYGPSCEFIIEYNENFLGRHGPREFKLKFVSGDDSDVYILKPPIAINGEYFQDFNDLDTVPSIKNFVCVSSKNFSHKVCVFVRNNDDNYTLRVSKPFSLFDAFCLALTTFHTGLLHR